jgi:hypothetical protein
MALKRIAVKFVGFLVMFGVALLVAVVVRKVRKAFS